MISYTLTYASAAKAIAGNVARVETARIEARRVVRHKNADKRSATIAAAVATGGPQLRTAKAAASSLAPWARKGRITYIGYANAANARAAQAASRTHASLRLI